MAMLGEATITTGASPARVWPLLCQLIQAGEWCDQQPPDQRGVDLITALPPEEFTFRVRAPRALLCRFRLLAVGAETQVRQSLFSREEAVLRGARLRLVASGDERPLELTPACERALQRLKERVEHAARR